MLEQENTELKHAVQDLKLQVEELRVMVFGKKKNQSSGDDDRLSPQAKTTERTRASYSRPLPRDTEITEIHHHPIDVCTHCHASFSLKKNTFFFEEDIPLPVQKIVRKHCVEQGYCNQCRKWSTSLSLPPAKVVLGTNIQKYTCYLSVLCRLSYAQIQHLLSDSYQIAVSEGEVAKILEREAVRLRPAYEQLKERIRSEGVIHLDETSWKLLIARDTTYAWVMSGAESRESIFLLGETRGRGNVAILRGEDYQGVTVTDDYGAYRHLENHQLCFSHLLRKFRDLAMSQELLENNRMYCEAQYNILSALYAEMKDVRDLSLYDTYALRLTKLATRTDHDPTRLARIKTTLMKNIPKYLTFLSHPSIPLTNNLAERSLRHLVLKRKVSFGSLTKRGADNLAILLSVLLSLRQRNPLNFMSAYLGV